MFSLSQRISKFRTSLPPDFYGVMLCHLAPHFRQNLLSRAPIRRELYSKKCPFKAPISHISTWGAGQNFWVSRGGLARSLESGQSPESDPWLRARDGVGIAASALASASALTSSSAVWRRHRARRHRRRRPLRRRRRRRCRRRQWRRQRRSTGLGTAARRQDRRGIGCGKKGSGGNDTGKRYRDFGGGYIRHV